MKVACFYADLHPATKLSVWRHCLLGVEFVDTSADDGAYWRAICERWDTGHDLVFIEQDIEIGPGMLETFEECPGQWCAYDYHAEPAGTGPLGFTRFRAALQHHVTTARISPDGYRHWAQVAPRMHDTIRRHGYEAPHIHGIVQHHHDYIANPPPFLVR